MRKLLIVLAVLLMPVTARAAEGLVSSSLPEKSYRFTPPQWICERVELLVDEGTLPASYKEVFRFPCEITPDAYGQMLVMAANNKDSAEHMGVSDALVLSLYLAYPSAVYVTNLTLSATPNSWLAETHLSNYCGYVPVEHWAYNAMSYLQQQGYLPGHAPSYFDGQEIHTRLQFALAVSAMLDHYEAPDADGRVMLSEGLPEQIKIMFDTLHLEFSDQIGFMGNGRPPQIEQVIEPKSWFCERVAMLAKAGVLSEGHLRQFSFPCRITPSAYAEMLNACTQSLMNHAADPLAAESIASLYLEYPGIAQLQALSFELAGKCLSESERRYTFEQTFWEVERENWSYEALDYLQEMGVLRGYPERYFTGAEPITRYKLAAAVARAIKQHPEYFSKSPRDGNEGQQVEQFKIMLQTLNAEFSDIMGLLGVKLEDVGGFWCFG